LLPEILLHQISCSAFQRVNNQRMNRTQLVRIIKEKKSLLCIGLDTDLTKIPKHLLSEDDPVFAFNKAIIDATVPYTVAYKINTAFYEAQGIKGWVSLQRTLEYIPKDIFTIADAKRGDIGNTADQYAHTFFYTYPFDSVTVAPYMGEDSLKPFLQHESKWAIVLGLTSNTGSRDFQLQQCGDELLYEKVLKTVAGWGTADNIMFVIGATQGEQLAHIRSLLPEHFFLIPGVGAQGGDVATVCSSAMNNDGGMLINVSRGVIYAGSGAGFAAAAGRAAAGYQQEMAAFL
jgi:orotidine-5'-phosphate decarboxylase